MYERANKWHELQRTDDFGNNWCACGWTGRDWQQHMAHVRKVRMEQQQQQEQQRDPGVGEDRPWISRTIEAGQGPRGYRYEINNLTEDEVLWIHDALHEKIIEVNQDLNDAVAGMENMGWTDPYDEDTMFLSNAIYKMARMVFLIRQMLNN